MENADLRILMVNFKTLGSKCFLEFQVCSRQGSCPMRLCCLWGEILELQFICCSYVTDAKEPLG